MEKFALTVIVITCLVQTYAQNYCEKCRDHTMCLYRGVGVGCRRRIYWGIKNNNTKTQIVNIHNRYRRKVAKDDEKRGDPGPQPPAADMNMMSWDNELASIAQRWADQCTFKHDACRRVDRFPWVGQNLYISGRWQSNGVHPDANQDWEEAIAAFYNEVVYFNNKNVDSFNSYIRKDDKEIGHYTQLVWGATYRVGCGFSAFIDTKDGKEWFRKYYVCDYGPGGNVVGEKVYTRGKVCSKCPPKSTCQVNTGLCVIPTSSKPSSSKPTSSIKTRTQMPFPTLPFRFPSLRWLF